MKKLIKYFSYCFLIISLCFIFCDESYVDAETFNTADNIQVCTDEHGELRECKDKIMADGSTEPDYFYGSMIKYDGQGNNAYCSDQLLSFFQIDSNGGSINYDLDSKYGNARICYYEANGQGHYDGDCSSILGFIIHEAESDNRYDDKNAKWMRTQLAIWMYLGRYGYNNGDGDIKTQNEGIAANWNLAPKIIEYITKGWEKYAAVHDIVVNSKDNVHFDIAVDDKNFYYQPSTSSCGVGFYRTKAFKIVNNESVAISAILEVVSNRNDVEVCSIKNNGTAECSVGKEVIILPGKSIEVFLKSEFDNPKNVSLENVSLEVSATYYSGNNSYIDIYDSKRYIPPSKYKDEKDRSGQGMIVLIEGQVKPTTDKTVVFSKVNIEKKNCEPTSNSNNGTPTNPVGKYCADNSTNSSDYEVEFKGCTCMGITLKNGGYVNILVGENANFRFGNLTPNEILYAGGGFGFAESGITTTYESIIGWQYANYKGGTPYYYNANNLSDWDASDIDVVQEIEAALKKKIKSSLSLNFSTRDSNDYLNTSPVSVSLNVPLSVPLKLKINNENNGNFEISSGTIKMKQAYFSSDGRVSYEDSLPNETYSINGGNKYYVPMGYSENVFPFDISGSNLSIVDGIDFWYKAECDKDVQDLYKSLYYRSIDLDNPFPKANNLTANVPENWKSWYCGIGTICNNVNNRKRLEDTYQNYPNGSLYEIVLNSDKFKKINAMTDYYTSWSNVNKDGVSSFITDMNLFETYASNKSYCSIGKFSGDCDE